METYVAHAYVEERYGVMDRMAQNLKL